jgi:hypothetical protein
VAARVGWTSVFSILTVSVTLDLVLDLVKWMSWYFAGENFDP